MAALIADGSIVVWILALVVVEAALLVLWRWRMRQGPRPREIVFNLASGAALLLALYGALADASWVAIAAWLGVALAAHVADLAVRWRR